MARFLQATRKSVLSSCKTLISQHPHQLSSHLIKPVSRFQAQFLGTHAQSSTTIPQKSRFEANIIRILRSEIEYQFEYAPPQQPAAKHDGFIVEDQPGEQWITLKGKFAADEDIKIEATMFDGSVLVPTTGDDGTGDDVQLHISLLVDISKGEGCDALEFVCSASPDKLEIQKVYVFRRDGSQARPYMGPDFWKMDKKLQKALHEFLRTRGVDDDLCVFLHQFVTNKDRTELIQWLGKVKYFVEK